MNISIFTFDVSLCYNGESDNEVYGNDYHNKDYDIDNDDDELCI